jgi:hypothetical protein
MASSRSISVGRGPVRAIRTLVQRPHGLGHGRVVAVDEQRVAQARVGMVAREVDLGDGLHRKGVQVVVGAGAQVVRAEDHVVHVQQQAAAGAAHQLAARKSVSDQSCPSMCR